MYAGTFRTGFTTPDDHKQFHATLDEKCMAEMQQAFTVDDIATACSCLCLTANKKNADIDNNFKCYY